MLRACGVAILLLLTLPAFAQQPTVSQTALAINQAVAQMAQSIDRLEARVDELEKQLKSCQAPAKGAPQ